MATFGNELVGSGLPAAAAIPAVAIAGGLAGGAYAYLVPWRGGVWLYKGGHPIVGTLVAIGGAVGMLASAAWVIGGVVAGARVASGADGG